MKKPLAGEEKPQFGEQAERQERLTTLGTLAAGIAHELNNPLSYVGANLDFGSSELEELLESSGGTLAPPVRERLVEIAAALADARAGAQQLRRVVREVRGFAAVTDEHPNPVDLRRVVESAVRLASVKVRGHARALVSFGPTPLVVASESRLCQVFVNLIVNAADACPPDHAETNEVHITTRTDGHGDAIIEVRDTGSGIDAAALPRIFDAFFTTKQREQGIGLGLSIVKEIVTSLGGSIDVESEVGKGSVFRVRLPGAASESVTPRSDSAAVPVRRGRVLIVDDDPAVLSATKRLLSLHHEVVALASGVEALELLRGASRFDAVLCELQMPGLSGVDLYEELVRLRPEMATRLVFIISGDVTPAARAFLGRVSNDRLFKPFDVVTVSAAIRKKLD